MKNYQEIYELHSSSLSAIETATSLFPSLNKLNFSDENDDQEYCADSEKIKNNHNSEIKSIEEIFFSHKN